MSRETRLAEVFIVLADTLVDDYDTVDLMTYLTEVVVELLNVDAAGIMLADQRGGLRLSAASNEAVRGLELFELETREGPCLDAFHSGAPVINVATATAATRWPRFVAAAELVGVQTTHAIPLRLRGSVIGAMNLFSRASTTLSADDANLGQALADMAAIGLIQERTSSDSSLLAEQLQSALNSRIVVEQAKGVLAERNGIAPDAAFAAMREHARRSRRKLTDVAGSIIDGSLRSL